MAFLGQIQTAAYGAYEAIYNVIYEKECDGSQYCYEPFSFEAQSIGAEDSLSDTGRAAVAVGIVALGAVGLTAVGVTRKGVQCCRNWMERRRLLNATFELDTIANNCNNCRDRASLYIREGRPEAAFREVQNGLRQVRKALSYLIEKKPSLVNSQLHDLTEQAYEQAQGAVSATFRATPSGWHVYSDTSSPGILVQEAGRRAQFFEAMMANSFVEEGSWELLYIYVMRSCMSVIGSCEYIVNAEVAPDSNTPSSIFRVDRDSVQENPREIFRRLGRELLDMNETFELQLVGEPAVDAGGVTREVFSILFKALMENEDGTVKGLLELGEDLSVYKGLGKCLGYIIRHPEISLKEYFNREQFRIIEAFSANELVTLAEETDGAAILPIKIKVKERLLGLELEGARDYIRGIMSFAERETLDFEGFSELHEMLEDGGVIDEKVGDLKESNPEEFKLAVGLAGIKFLDRYNVDKLITLALYLVDIPSILHAEDKAERIAELQGVITKLHTEEISYLDFIQAPMDAVKLAKAIVNGSMNSLTADQRVALLQKTELIKSWVVNTATPKQRVDFYCFATANSGFAREVPIKIVAGSSLQMGHIAAHTCHTRLDLSHSLLVMDDADFIRVLENEIASGVAVGFTIG